MALLEEELDIISVEKLLDKDMELPPYQRPYRWSDESANTLFNDILSASISTPLSEYRLGAVILYKNKDKCRYEIVDGQQRITTICLLLHLLCVQDKLPNLAYTEASLEALQNNYELLKERVHELADSKPNFISYLLYHCTFVCIVTDSHSEAFQFFDSQNHRGKELKPHDLLKAFHLREMGSEEEKTKVAVVEKWEGYKEKDLVNLFSDHLYPLTQWYKNQDGLYYSSSKIKTFKGAYNYLSYNYVIYHKAANMFIEDMNRYSNEFNRSPINQFQLTQPLISGTRFFMYVNHYVKLLSQVDEMIKRRTKECIIPQNGNGNKYVMTLFRNVLMFFTDRFGLASITDIIYNKIFVYCFSIRVVMFAVYPQTINKYAQGGSYHGSGGINVFARISEMLSPEEMSLIKFGKPELRNKKFQELYSTLCSYYGWE